MKWCEDKTLLSGVFSLDSSSATSDAYCSLVCKFIRENNLWNRTENDKKALNYVLNVLDSDRNVNISESSVFIKWMSEYKCALVAKLDQGCHETQMRYISLVGLDKWKHRMHNTNENVRMPTRLTEGYSYKTSNFIKHDQFEEFLDCFETSKNGSRRHIKKTPGFIESVLNDAHILLQQSKVDRQSAVKLSPPCDGWSEVTEHIGGGWPLFSAVCKHLFSFLPSSDVETLHNLFLCYFEMWILKKQLIVSSPSLRDPKYYHSCTTQHINLVMKMLTSVARKVANLSAAIHVRILQNECTWIRKQLDELITSRNKDVSSMKTMNLEYADASLKPSVLLTLPDESEKHYSMRDIKKESRKNISSISLPINNGISIVSVPDLLQWAGRFQNPNMTELHLVLSTIETAIFSMSKKLIILEHTPVQVELLEELVFLYRRHVNVFLSHLSRTETGDYRSMLRVEIFSKEVLIVWISYCLIHKYLKNVYPLIQKFGVALSWNDIRYFVLSDKEAIEASLVVSKYLKSNTNIYPLFSLSKEDVTFEFAKRYVLQSAGLKDILKREMQDAKERTDVHWKAVLNKQIKVKELRNEMQSKGIEIDELEDQLKEKGTCLKSYTSEIIRINLKFEQLTLERAKQKLHDEVKTILGKIDDAKIPPDPVYQALPKQESKAFIFLFFIYMPLDMNVLAQFTIMAQQMLLPDARKYLHTALDKNMFCKIHETVKIPVTPQTDIKAYYNRYSKLKSTSRLTIEIRSNDKPPKTVGYKDVMDYYSQNDGIWYPDDLSPLFAWKGGMFELDQTASGHFINPFERVDHRYVTDYFTEKSIDISLQWIMPQYGAAQTCRSRGNQPIAFQNKKPDWLKKNQWLEISTLRAFPNQQLRNICRVLSDRLLPFDSPFVHTVIVLALYHIGDVSKDLNLEWKFDQYFGDFGKAIEEELNDIADEFSTKPRDYRSMLLFIEITSYMIQWNASCQKISRKFVSMFKTWIADLDQQILNADPKYAIEIRMKKALFCKYAILCYAKGSLTREDASELVKFILLAHKDDGISFKDNSIGQELTVLTTKSRQVIFSRIADIIVQAKGENYAMFTSAIKLIIYSTPNNLQWRSRVRVYEMKCTLSFFEARSLDNDLYSLNIANGIVLFNGRPISQLPESILLHPQYIRTFNGNKFEICVSKGVFTTTMPINGFIYTFELYEDQLTIREIDSKTKAHLQLLQPQGTWSKELPVRLIEMHSHWYCSQKNIIFLRDKTFRHRNIYFAIQNDANKELWTCFIIPLHLHENVWDKLCDESLNLKECYELITDNELATIFEKFEDTKFIHIYLSKEGTKIIDLPRFKLKFQWRKSFTVIESLDYTSYVVCPCQQLDDTLIGFQRYLLLEGNTDGYTHTKVIIPAGKVTKCQDGIDVVGVDKCDYDWSVYSYDIHPRLKCLQATSIGSRLQLAELYAATSSLLPEIRMKMTGEEVAMQLVRQCWTNQPMEMDDYKRLENISKLCHHVPGLSLICYEVGKSSLQTGFLHQTDKPIIKYPVDASNDYVQRERPWNIRSRLACEEEFRVFGRNESFSTDIYTFPKINNQCQNITKSGVVGIKHFEDQLDLFLINEIKHQDLIRIDDGDEQQLLLKKLMKKDLAESNRIYSRMPEFKVDKNLILKIPDLLRQICKKRSMLEDYLIKNITELQVKNMNDVRKTNYFKILRAANISPKLSLEDMMKAACSINYLKYFNPFRSKSDLNTLHSELLTWLQFCVLENKMQRLYALNKDSNETNTFKFVKELRSVRVWPVKKHPEWLVFEAVALLQIRPLQYSVAMTIIDGIDSTGVSPIMQLNMGEGKTRVILPMLILYWLRSDKLLRINFLAALINEAFTYLHQQLSTTLFGCKLHTLPFSRDVHISKEQALTMYKSLEYCKNFKGILLITPEQRLSLKLKWYELDAMKETEICGILAKMSDLPYIDILDECDEILRIKKKLLYSCGSPEQLSSGYVRWCLLQKLFRSIEANEQIRALLYVPGVALWKQGNSNLSAVFQEFRIIEGKEFEKIKRHFYQMLYADILKEPPFQLRWIRKSEYDLNMSDCVDFVTNPDANAEIVSKIKNTMVNDFLLSLRGFLANDILIHCLIKRNRVDYGIKRPSKKRMAVPFHAIESPADRAEFAQPDCALVFTFLAYYYDGLSKQQVVEAFNALLSIGDMAQKSIYQIWFDLSKPTIIEDSCGDKLDSVAKIDLSNNTQVSLLVKYYQYNTATINFWLESVVLPVETMQFPSRLEATTWDIATNSSKKVAGFSGTNDNQILLPSSLRWIDSNNRELKATDGKMIHLIYNNSSFCLLTKELNVAYQKPSVPLQQWREILDTVVSWSQNKEGVRFLTALIDSGALMAGPSNKDIAAYLAKRLDREKFQGVVYFHLDQWWVRDYYGREWPKHASPIHEKDAFVYFDESRCRGTDMKLKTNSEAVLTLGPNMCKDKLMQAAGRMRQLENGQKLLVIAPGDVIEAIRSINNLISSDTIKPGHILKWVLSNTVASVSEWLIEWGVQGLQHLIKLGDSNLAILPDKLDLKQMYGHEFSEQAVPEVWRHLRASILSRKDGKRLIPLAAKILSDVDKRMQKYGTDIKVRYSNLEDECERQLEKEIEIEEEVEIQVQPQIPFNEQDWEVCKLVSCSNRHNMFKSVVGLGIMSLASFIETRIFYKGTPIKKRIRFSWPINVFGTTNFFSAIQSTHTSSLNDFQRNVNSFLLFQFGFVLLLSEREADKVLQYSWDGKNMNNVSLVNLTYGSKKYFKSDTHFQTPKLANFSPSEEIIAALHLFQGIVTFDLDKRKKAIQEILGNDLAKSAAFMFSSMRGFSATYQYSDLDEICVTLKQDQS